MEVFEVTARQGHGSKIYLVLLLVFLLLPRLLLPHLFLLCYSYSSFLLSWSNSCYSYSPSTLLSDFYSHSFPYLPRYTPRPVPAPTPTFPSTRTHTATPTAASATAAATTAKTTTATSMSRDRFTKGMRKETYSAMKPYPDART